MSYCGSLFLIFLCAIALSFAGHSLVWGLGLWVVSGIENYVIYAAVWIPAMLRLNRKSMLSPIYSSLVVLVTSLAFLIGPHLRGEHILFFPHLKQSQLFIATLIHNVRVEDINLEISVISAFAVFVAIAAGSVAVCNSIFAIDGWVSSRTAQLKNSKRVTADMMPLAHGQVDAVEFPPALKAQPPAHGVIRVDDVNDQDIVIKYLDMFNQVITENENPEQKRTRSTNGDEPNKSDALSFFEGLTETNKR